MPQWAIELIVITAAVITFWAAGYFLISKRSVGRNRFFNSLKITTLF